MKALFALFLLGFVLLAEATPNETPSPTWSGLVDIGNNQSLYAEIWRGRIDIPPVFMINGLTQDTEHWQKTMKTVLESGATVIRYDGLLQGRSLMAYLKKEKVLSQMGTRPILTPLLGTKIFWGNKTPLIPPTSDEEQVDALHRLIEKVSTHKKVTLVGLSYGGGIALLYGATHPDTIQSLVLEAPYVSPEPQQDKQIKNWIRAYKQAFPFQTYSDDDLYDYNLRAIVLSTYHFSEPSILKWGFFQPYGATSLITGIRHLDSHKLVQKLPPHSLHLVIAEKDAYIPREALRTFWQAAPANVRASLLTINGVEHKMNESVGPFVGTWTKFIIQRENTIKGGREFQGWPEQGLVESLDGKVRLNLPETEICEYLLLQPKNRNDRNLPIDRIIRHPFKRGG